MSSASKVREAAAPARARYRRLPTLARVLFEMGTQPYYELRLVEGGPVILRGRAGSYALFIGWEGSGKSTMMLQLGLVAVRAGLTFIYFTTELDAEEAAARVVGIDAHEGWEDVERARVAQHVVTKALAQPNFIILAGDDDATLDNLEATIIELRAEQPNRQIVVVVDYLQDLELEGRDERSKVRSASKAVRRLTKRQGVFTIGISQTSRAGRGELRRGDAVGAETVTMGAESSQLERDAYMTLALGNDREQPDGSVVMDLNVGKSRKSKGNVVFVIRFAGRIGETTHEGEVKTAAVVRAERQDVKDGEKITAAIDRIVGELARSADPMTPNSLRAAIHGNREVTYQACNRLRDGAHADVVRVEAKKTGLHLWNRSKAVSAGMRIVEALYPVSLVSRDSEQVSQEHQALVSQSPSRGHHGSPPETPDRCPEVGT